MDHLEEDTPLSGDPRDFLTWSDWAYSMMLWRLLTPSEVSERLMLEYQVQKALGVLGTFPPAACG